jgi:hypothetical protein
VNAAETRDKVAAIMDKVGARTLAEVRGPNDSALRFYATGGGVVVVQFWHDGGCTHYIGARDALWSTFEADLAALTLSEHRR